MSAVWAVYLAIGFVVLAVCAWREKGMPNGLGAFLIVALWFPLGIVWLLTAGEEDKP